MARNPYETDSLLQQYLIFHYATPEEQFSYSFGGADGLEFPRRCAAEGVRYDKLEVEAPRALDLGCAVGRSTFELARNCREVIGIDSSGAFIEAANRLKMEGRHKAVRIDEGAAKSEITVHVESSIDRFRASFEQGDAQELRPSLGQFDIILACNLICRLPDPSRLLRRLPGLLRPRGQLVITTPFTWLDSYTPPENWLGGGTDSFKGLHEALDPAFELDVTWDMPFLLREHARKFQYSVAHASRWIRAANP